MDAKDALKATMEKAKKQKVEVDGVDFTGFRQALPDPSKMPGWLEAFSFECYVELSNRSRELGAEPKTLADRIPGFIRTGLAKVREDIERSFSLLKDT